MASCCTRCVTEVSRAVWCVCVCVYPAESPSRQSPGRQLHVRYGTTRLRHRGLSFSNFCRVVHVMSLRRLGVHESQYNEVSGVPSVVGVLGGVQCCLGSWSCALHMWKCT
jgi:hypothetical protein